jgi:hypothetical protein
MSSPTQRSLARLKSDGWTVCIVEKYIPMIKQRKDAFGFGDLLACKIGQPGALLVQTTSGSNAANRANKIFGIAEAGIWLAAGNRIVVHGWAKRGPRGKRKVWSCVETEIRADDIQPEGKE